MHISKIISLYTRRRNAIYRVFRGSCNVVSRKIEYKERIPSLLFLYIVVYIIFWGKFTELKAYPSSYNPRNFSKNLIGAIIPTRYIQSPLPITLPSSYNILTTLSILSKHLNPTRNPYPTLHCKLYERRNHSQSTQ